MKMNEGEPGAYSTDSDTESDTSSCAVVKREFDPSTTQLIYAMPLSVEGINLKAS